MKLELRQHFNIESARFLPLLPDSHPCKHIHGHSFQITLRLVGEQNSIGWVKDYNEIAVIVKPIISLIDHKVLNHVQGLENPTTENICIWLYDKLKPHLSELEQVIICETKDTESRFPVL